MSAALAWPFVFAAYAATIGGTAILLGWSLLALRRAEARANALNRRRDD
jgi:uncharacterized membrane protein YgdD (TMEM256/DUF423 family)